jgi:calcineurin-like phosphoesterase family protein
MKDIKRDIIDKITPEAKADMEKIWFTSDLHHGHDKIVNICNRNTTPENQTDWLVKEVINKYVGKGHTLYMLGDISMAKKESAEKFLDRLNGNKFLILGNHDKNLAHSTRFSQITQIKDFTYTQFGLNLHIVLSHYPIASWNRKIHGSWHLYGHVHGRFQNTGLSFDVGIDNRHGFGQVNGPHYDTMWKPINLYQVCVAMDFRAKALEKAGEAVHVEKFDNL